MGHLGIILYHTISRLLSATSNKIQNLKCFGIEENFLVHITKV